MEINPAAMAFLLEAEDGPVGRFVTRKAVEVREHARVNVRRIMHRLPSVADQVNYEQQGTEAIVGINDHVSSKPGKESPEEYLANKEAFELAWLFPAVQDAFPAE